jgi:hypothetical protein
VETELSAIDPTAPYFVVGRSIVTFITSAQLKVMVENPITLVPAEGPNTLVIVDKLVLQYQYGSVAYSNTASLDLQIAYNTNNLAQIISVSSADLLGLSYSTVYMAYTLWADSNEASLCTNEPVTLANVGTDYTLGNGTLLIKTYYTVETLPLRV